ncbi:5-carboxymethyl-2-hydroxymuconate Delta-isomerase [Thalassotalea sp. M1531]|uniref:5-carboxymethyl-2-hydroxymuconate Delta-isomerase n=1 Tax=Thalassotalea algicola TaxID=2716224 RepID=A0A7Y0Q6X5_9GAMM|nr:5-carboxymethyl-2-hydroxymuconate Delta-isomerase [Thalassotalea algicola]NMP31277.1 5-carboxymethyl-2-hydroxymuconate Delta-isomerase [Thalassotalea algicola]
MPHCIIEYSADVESQTSAKTLIGQVQAGALASNLFEPEHIKLRTCCFDHSRIGTSAKGFIHVTARVLSGRTLEQRQHLSNCLLKTLQNMSLQELSLTVEIIEMERESYNKCIV